MDTAHPRLSLKMVEESSVRRFAAALGVGKVYGPYGPYESDLSVRPHFTWVATGSDALRAAAILHPLVSTWRQQKLAAMALAGHVETVRT